MAAYVPSPLNPFKVSAWTLLVVNVDEKNNLSRDFSQSSV
jgi:hypothetical protein